MKYYNTVLTIAGSDNSGGAGIQADIKTITALKCYAASVITVLTAQNTQGVSAIYPVEADFIAKQMDAIFDDFTPNAIKIGMLHNEACIEVLQQKLSILKQKKIPVVLDPVMIAQAGTSLISKTAIQKLKTLFEYVDVITPNIPEAEALTHCSINTIKAMENAAKQLGDEYTCAVLVKGGHLAGDHAIDILYHPETSTIQRYESIFINTKNNHGTGCTLSSALACFLATNHNLAEAVKQAKNFIQEAIESGKQYQLGQGTGPVNHLFNIGDS